MAAERRGLSPMTVNLPRPSIIPVSDTPPISALFLIRFDLKAGYTLGWKRALPGIELEGVVEYKSLPSGLHTVENDLIYFVHGEYAGLSAFVSAPASQEQRNAVMIAVGILVPLSFGRLGRCWKHAEQLKNMAQELVGDTGDVKVLEKYWTDHIAQGPIDSAESTTPTTSSPAGNKATHKNASVKQHNRQRSASEGMALLAQEHKLSAHHPAWSLSQLLSKFGPLIFPVYRAALLRKRILISCHAPVQEVCDFVYNISVLSNVPLRVNSLILPSAPPSRIRPLFTIGVHDIPLLEEDLKASETRRHSAPSDVDTSDELGNGWIACTTDGIIGSKHQLYDLLVTMPTSEKSTWPDVQSSDQLPMRATQRDLRRYRALNWSLSRQAHTPSLTRSPSTAPSLQRRPSTNTFLTTNEAIISLPETDSVVEPLSWSALAYSGFLWWASAGSPEISSNDEFSADAALLDDLPASQAPTKRNSKDMGTVHGPRSIAGDEEARKETSIIAYFHRLTTNLFTILSDIIQESVASDSESLTSPQTRNETPFSPVGSDDTTPLTQEVEDAEEVILITNEDMTRMGLDDWSSADHTFIIEICMLCFGRKAVVEGKNLDICGVRIC